VQTVAESYGAENVLLAGNNAKTPLLSGMPRHSETAEWHLGIAGSMLRLAGSP